MITEDNDESPETFSSVQSKNLTLKGLQEPLTPNLIVHTYTNIRVFLVIRTYVSVDVMMTGKVTRRDGNR